ncbi:MAG: hypothetical protein U0270_07855 [Labilithrix sp.]
MKWSRGELLAALAALGCTALLAVLQPAFTAKLKPFRYQTSVLDLPPAAHVKRMSLGYHSALVDVLWAKLLVEQGLHFQDKRRFEALPSYLDAIIELEPRFTPVYEYVDTLLLFQYLPGGDREAHLARSYLERGTRERPYDHRVWLHYGQYLAFLAPSFLSDKAEAERWRTDGAIALARAVDLGADADRGLAASTILDKAGERKAAIAQLQRHYALTDDPDTRRQIRLKLERMNATVEAEGSINEVEQLWRGHYPFLSRGEVLLIGPRRDGTRCAGSRGYDRECAADWNTATR